MIKFISNDKQFNHAVSILQLLRDAQEVYIMVAFLKKSGLKQLFPCMDHLSSCTILAGVNFGLTDPDALSMLLDRSKIQPGFSGYLTRLDMRQVFHPKIYLFRKGIQGHLIVGSANMTNGGLVANSECSIYHQCHIDDPIWKEARAFFDAAIKPAKADALGERVIALYRTYHEDQKKRNKGAKPSPDLGGNLIYNLDRLRDYYQRIDQARIKMDLAKKVDDYRRAAEVLHIIESEQHSATGFQELLEMLAGKAGEGRLWHSNGLFRKKGTIFNEQEKFRKLLSCIKGNLNRSPEFIYEQAIRISTSIHGLGPGWLGEIMMTFAPSKLANINQNPITALRKVGGVSIKVAPRSYTGADYGEYNAIVHEVATGLGLPDMLSADYLFNEIFQDLKKKIATNLS